MNTRDKKIRPFAQFSRLKWSLAMRTATQSILAKKMTTAQAVSAAVTMASAAKRTALTSLNLRLNLKKKNAARLRSKPCHGWPEVGLNAEPSLVA